MANVEKLREVLDYIKNNPQSWEQGVWYVHRDSDGSLVIKNEVVEVEEVNSCGSAFCFAGHAALKNGFPPPPEENGAEWLADVNGQTFMVEQYAQNVLELTSSQADALFDASNTLEDLEWMIEQIENNPKVFGLTLEDNRPSMSGSCWSDCDCCCEDDYEEEEVW